MIRGWRMQGLPEETSVSGGISCEGNDQKTPLFSSFIFPLIKKKPFTILKNCLHYRNVSGSCHAFLNPQAWKKEWRGTNPSVS